MGILHRNSQAIKEENLKILKRQYGGVIPFYASYTYRAAPTAPYNPSLLLAKYQGVTPTKTEATGSGAAKKDNLELKGLTNDVNFFTDQYRGLQMEIEEGERQNPNFKNTKAGQMAYSRLDLLTTAKLNELNRNEEEFNAAQTIMENNGAKNTWMFQNGTGLAMTIDKETNQTKFDWIEPERLNNEIEETTGQRKWKEITYGDAAILRATSMDPNFLNNEGFAMRLSHGIGMNKVLTDYIDPIFKDIGMERYKNESKVGGQLINNEVIKEISEGSTDESNLKQLQSAFNTLHDQLKDTPAYDSLLATFWETSKTPTEVEQKMNQYFALQMMKRLKLTTERTSTDMLDYDNTFKLMTGGAGGSGGPVKRLSKYIPAWAGLTNPEQFELEALEADAGGKKLSYKPGVKTQKTSFPAYQANEANQLWTPTIDNKNSDGEVVKTAVPMSKQTTFNQVGNLQGAILPDGTLLKNLTFNFGGEYQMTGLDAMTPSSSAGTYVVTVPVDKSTGGVIKFKGIEEFNKLYDNIQKERKNDDAAMSGSVEANAKYDQRIKNLENKYLRAYTGKVEYKKFYAVDVIYNNYAQPESMENIRSKKVSGEDITAYNNAFVDAIDATGTFNDADEPEYFSRTTVLIPANNALAHQQADPEATVYVGQGAVMSGTLAQNPGNQGRTLTSEEIINQIRNENSFNISDYFSQKSLY